MGPVDALEELQSELKRRVADVSISVDAPDSEHGTWWIDVRHEGRSASVEWRPQSGFGIAASGGGYGEGVDVVAAGAADAADEVVRLLRRDEWISESWEALAKRLLVFTCDLLPPREPNGTAAARLVLDAIAQTLREPNVISADKTLFAFLAGKIAAQVETNDAMTQLAKARDLPRAELSEALRIAGVDERATLDALKQILAA